MTGNELGFDLRQEWREKLVTGWDDIELTRRHAEALRAYSRKIQQDKPWEVPRIGVWAVP